MSYGIGSHDQQKQYGSHNSAAPPFELRSITRPTTSGLTATTEYIIQLADFVDGRMSEISSGTLTVDSLKVAILAALHIADELHRLKNMHEQADSQLAARSAECAEMLDRLLKVRSSVENEQGGAGKLCSVNPAKFQI